MCGIVGIYSKHMRGGEARRLLTEMGRRIAYRGPDDYGEWSHEDGGIYFGHRRLSIIDLSPLGHQPMIDETGNYVVVFNGEIYNFGEIRDELSALGYLFRSKSDTEVILLGYKAWGKSVVNRLRGMFAFAIWDGRTRELWLVRDRLAKKPLYYWQSEDCSTFLFASEIKSLLAYSEVKREMDPVGFSSFVRLGYVIPPYTMFRGIRKLRGGEWMCVLQDGSVQRERYWQIQSIGQDSRSSEVLGDDLARIFGDAVQLRLVSDVPLGAYLSGGLDSSSVVAIMSRFLPRPVDTFSVSHSIGERSVKYNVDARYAQIMARAYHTNHREFVLEKNVDLQDILRQTLIHLDEPYANYSYLSTYGLARFIKSSGITVVLSGDGGDEVFGGYAHYSVEWKLRFLRRVPLFLRNALMLISPTFAKAVHKSFASPVACDMYFNWRNQLPLSLLVGRELHEEFLSEVTRVVEEAPTQDSVQRLMYVDMMLWIAEESNTRMDRLTMAASLESRAPFLDHVLVEFGMNLPLQHKVTYKGTKCLLREVMGSVLPSEILTRSKWGFFAPVHYWLKDSLHQYVQDILTEERVRRVGLFQYEPIQRMFQEEYNPYSLWSLLTFHLWYDTYIAHEPVFR